MSVKELVMESVFSFRLWQSLILVKLQAFTLNGSETFCGVCFYLHYVAGPVSSQASGLYYE